ncbi:MAG: glycosyltransferase [Isosphaeraceae bacterium]|nr:glycosyltransferase [Isosphaeraceae bacterium]
MQALARRLATAPRRPWPDRPVPVVLVITDLDIGGAERALVALARGLDRRRWGPSVVCLGPEGRLVEPLRAEGIATDCLAVERDQPIRAVLRLARALRARRPWLVQSFLFHANIASRLAAPLAGWPWVVGGLRVAERRPNRHLMLDRWTARLAAGSVCVSEGVRRFSITVGGLDPDRLTVIPNGIDVGPIDRAELVPRDALGVPREAHLALFVGRLEEQKGVRFLIEAAERVAAARPDWQLALVGDGPERERLGKQAAGSACLAGRVHWLGRREDVPGLLKAADLLVLPSLWEGMPNVVLEAMAARRAVVATAVEGTEDLVLPGRTGWLVPPADPAALANALLDAAADPDRLRQFGQAGRDRIESEFTPQRVIAAYEHLWAGLLGLQR